MKLYVCYGTWKSAPRPGGHPCGVAYHALRDAGYEPEVKLSYGLGGLPGFLNERFGGRREVKRLTGNYWVPVLVTDEGTVVQGSREIAAWARENPTGRARDTEGPSAGEPPAGGEQPAGEPSAGGEQPAGGSSAGGA